MLSIYLAGISIVSSYDSESLKNGSVCCVLLKQGDVRALKHHLRKLHSHPVSLQQLVRDGSCLQDDDRVDSDTELHLVLLSVVSDAQSWQAGKELVDYAAHMGDLQATRSLLQAGAKTDLRDDAGQTALMHAAWGGHVQIVRLLVEHGADKDMLSFGITYGHVSSWHGSSQRKN